MASYLLDSHHVQYYVTDQGFTQNEDDIGVLPPKPYRIALGSILPKQEECKNLIFPVLQKVPQ